MVSFSYGYFVLTQHLTLLDDKAKTQNLMAPRTFFRVGVGKHLSKINSLGSVDNLS